MTVQLPTSRRPPAGCCWTRSRASPSWWTAPQAQEFTRAHWLVNGADGGRLFARRFVGNGTVRENVAGCAGVALGREAPMDFPYDRRSARAEARGSLLGHVMIGNVSSIPSP